ncbi:MAG: hypothetical protein H6Q15_1013 [Bacteroidetes bacterium]|nr:hypothetical protein [Bacteroidota bacterium]
MIQRIQTLWMAFVVLLTVATFFFPLAIFSFDFKSLQFNEIYGLLPTKLTPEAMPLVQKTPAWSLIFMQLGIALISLVAIFLYKNRSLQLKVLSAAFLLLAIYVGYLFLYRIDGLSKEIAAIYSTPKVTYAVGCYFPILQLLLMILAQRAIRKDERLVRSSDRLR